MTNLFAPAAMTGSKLRIAYDGPSGSGKTYTAILQAVLMLDGELTDKGAYLPRRPNGLARIAVIDTERGSAQKYAKDFASDDKRYGAFDVLVLDRNENGAVDPRAFIQAIETAEEYGYEYLVIDSLSHAWEGILDEKDKVDEAAKAKSRGNYTNTFANWREVTPLHNKLIDACLTYDGHVAVTMRTKTEYVQEKDEKGYTVIRKVGLKPIQRDGVDFEFDIVLDMMDNIAYVGKSRCKPLREMASINKPGKEMATVLTEWLDLAEPLLMLTREDFIAKMNELGYGNNQAIGAFIKNNGLEIIGGDMKYTRIYTMACQQKGIEPFGEVPNSSDDAQSLADSIVGGDE